MRYSHQESDVFRGQLYNPHYGSFLTASLIDSNIELSNGYRVDVNNMYIQNTQSPTVSDLNVTNSIGILYSGFKLFNQDHMEEFYAESKREAELWYDQLKKFVVQTDFCNNFELVYPLQEDEFTNSLNQFKVKQVYKAKRRTDDGNYYAVKQFDKKSEKFESSKDEIWKEINYLKNINHPYIIKLLELFEDNQSISLVFEYYPGGTLKNGNVYSEAKVKVLMSNLLDSIQCLHSQNLIHRDIKPQNVLLRDTSNFYDMVLIDFGFVVHCTQKVSGRMGTPGYVAPEVLNAPEYDWKSDLYSAGIIMFTALTGQSPFQHRNLNELLYFNYEGKVSFDLLKKFKISDEGLDLLYRLLEKNPDNRISTVEAIHHQWFSKEDLEHSPVKKYLQQDDFTVKDQNDTSKSWQVPRYSMKTHFPKKKSQVQTPLKQPYTSRYQRSGTKTN